jgi:glutaredoxin
MTEEKKAVLYRMVMHDHICPFGIKSKDLLKREGYDVDDRHLTTREETDAFKEKHDVKTTPQTFIEGHKIGGYDDLRAYFGKRRQQNKGETSYQPVIAVFVVTFLMAVASSLGLIASFSLISLLELFVAFSMCVLAILKLRDMFSFTNMFIGYDLLGRRWVPYAYIYPFAEAFVGIGMLAGMLTFMVAPVAIFIGSVGATSVFKAVYLDKRDLKCACVGGSSNVPLGFVSLTENLMMVAIGIWMIVKSVL